MRRNFITRVNPFKVATGVGRVLTLGDPVFRNSRCIVRFFMPPYARYNDASSALGSCTGLSDRAYGELSRGT